MVEQSVESRVPQWHVGDRLRKAREIAGFGQAELAEQIGISRRSVGNYEAGTTTPKRPVLLSWALMTGVPYGWLTTGVHENAPRLVGEGQTNPALSSGWSRRAQSGRTHRWSPRTLRTGSPAYLRPTG